MYSHLWETFFSLVRSTKNYSMYNPAVGFPHVIDSFSASNIWRKYDNKRTVDAKSVVPLTNYMSFDITLAEPQHAW